MNWMLKVLIGLVLAVIVVWLLFTKVFPWVDANFITDPILEARSVQMDLA